MAAQHSAGILSSGVTVDELRTILFPANAWHPFPRVGEREGWLSIRANVREAHIGAAEPMLHGNWPQPKATDLLEFVRTGNRSGFQKISFDRRGQLATLVLAECMEGNGRFLDDIVNGIWTICEETYWGVPAHLSLQKAGFGLPDVREPTVDLFAAETAALLAWTSYLLKDSLDRISPLVCDRIQYEVERRLLRVNGEREDFWWMGVGQKVNNWVPWICSNWLAAVLIFEHDPARRAQAVHKILVLLDRFLAEYADDGGCDEGPGYWTRAAGSLFDCLELLRAATGNRIDGFSHPRIQEMGRYIIRTHIQGPYFINFADAAAKTSPDAGTVFRYGQAIQDSTMMRFGAFLAIDQRLGQGALRGQFGVLGRVLPGLFGMEELLRARPAEPLLRDFWLPGVQVMGVRSIAGSRMGLYLAAQGGHNDESHNHNDVGNFIVYADGMPAIIDVGVETYTAKTFSKDRYSIWTMQSAYHNVPTINGYSQQDGRDFEAREVHYVADDSTVTFSLDIAGAYPPAAAVKSWTRTLSFVRGRTVTLRDVYSLGKSVGQTFLTLMSFREPVIVSPGRVLLGPAGTEEGTRNLLVSYNAAVLTAEAEPIPIRDSQLQSSWGETIYRLKLIMANPGTSGEIRIDITQD